MEFATSPGRKMLALILGSTLVATCTAPSAGGEALVEPPMPTPFGTVYKKATSTVPTVTPSPIPRPKLCIFPVDVDGTGDVQEAALYRFSWVQGKTSQTMETRAGPIQLEGSITIPAGERQLVVVHRGPLPKSFEITDKLSPAGTLLYDQATRASEVRDAEGIVIRQTIADLAEDVRGLHPNLDIIKVERQFGTGNGFIIRVTLVAPDDGKYIWTFETVELLLGTERYAERTMHTGQVLSVYYDPEGEYSEWDGTMVVQANTITWALTAGGDLPFGARSSTSASAGDSTSLFPVHLMERLWQTSEASCG